MHYRTAARSTVCITNEKNRPVRSILAMGVAIALAIALAGCSSSTPSGTSASGDAVTIQGSAFNPSALTVKVGTTVTWTQKDSIGHFVKWPDSTPPSNTLALDQTYQRTFDTAGSFPYVCGIHSFMTGMITVTN
jgi:plastocyanin